MYKPSQAKRCAYNLNRDHFPAILPFCVFLQERLGSCIEKLPPHIYLSQKQATGETCARCKVFKPADK